MAYTTYEALTEEEKERKRENVRRWRKTAAGIANRKAYQKKTWKKFLEYQKWRRLSKAYGLSKKEYLTLLEEQNGCCALCGVHHSQLNKRLCVDHNHVTGVVRGLLCSSCNFALGLLKVDTVGVALLKNCIAYVKESSKCH